MLSKSTEEGEEKRKKKEWGSAIVSGLLWSCTWSLARMERKLKSQERTGENTNEQKTEAAATHISPSRMAQTPESDRPILGRVLRLTWVPCPGGRRCAPCRSWPSLRVALRTRLQRFNDDTKEEQK